MERGQVEQEQEQELLLKRLKPVETGYRRELCCMNGTRQSLLNQVTDWVANELGQENLLQRNAYWFYGSPGIGKTSLAHSICATLHERNHLAGEFFCRRDDPNLSESINILPTFIYKLAILFPHFRSIVAKHLRDDPNLTPESMKGALFLDLIHSLPRHPERTLVFVIDALDECGDAQSRPHLLKVLTDATAQAPWLKIIITSRTEVDIQHFFDTLNQSSYIPYDLATDRDASTDLRAFARSKFDSVALAWDLGTPCAPSPNIPIPEMKKEDDVPVPEMKKEDDDPVPKMKKEDDDPVPEHERTGTALRKRRQKGDAISSVPLKQCFMDDPLRRTLILRILAKPWLHQHQIEPGFLLVDDDVTIGLEKQVSSAFGMKKGDSLFKAFEGQAGECPFDGCLNIERRAHRRISHVRTHFGLRPFSCDPRRCARCQARIDRGLEYTYRSFLLGL